MPRGIPNVKRDDTQGMRYTSFHVPLQLNPKHPTNTYLKSESQTIWTRNAGKRKAVSEDVGPSAPLETRRGSNVIVIHPGSRYLRIGRASELNPVYVPNVIARKTNPPVPPVLFEESIVRPRKGRTRSSFTKIIAKDDKYIVNPGTDDPFDDKFAKVQGFVLQTMSYLKLRVSLDAPTKASSFNRTMKPEIIPQELDSERINFITKPPEDEVLVGDDALRLADPSQLGYVLRWPIHADKLNTKDYPSNQMLLDDIEAIVRITLKDKLGITSQTVKNYSVILVIPDYYERSYIRNFVHVLLSQIGFKQFTVQQQSLAATYGAGLSSACVVDVGAVSSCIACVDEGMIIPETRLVIGVGGDHVTEFLAILLQGIDFPYKELDLARRYDWNVIEDIKYRLCSLNEQDVALNLYSFTVRAPGKPTEKYGLRAYDEFHLAPSVMFFIDVVNYDKNRFGRRPIQHPDIADEIVNYLDHGYPIERYTEAIMQSAAKSVRPPEKAPGTQQTQVLAVTAPPQSTLMSVEGTPLPTSTAPEGEASTATPSNGSVPPPQRNSAERTSTTEETAKAETDKASTEAPPMDIDVEGDTNPQEVIDVDAIDSPIARPQPNDSAVNELPSWENRFTMDLEFEASKTALDLAIFNSCYAGSGGYDRVKKFLGQGVLLVGGGSMIKGMSQSLQSRLSSLCVPLVSNMPLVQIQPPPKDVDPRVLIWKGASVLGKMDGVSELWVTREDWDLLGMRALRERCFYL
ncbi:actin-like ATPase domain-containing protein [Stereum hirsutum FP-91666 SS1]|uniref:actin-like ATPase domain-containing protein n=1 Tax=Stereum hirsutum (strain FP-91666) TaxID=721885 RepID=UPI000444A3B9|nr:actin-like ATPase domain-containing protein [Stereum hirsutum FP-91666 SS1]EIM86889.1 actin-like ATPase domain-containing protein [Stereum hirsutum FP-91666 SS1]